MQSLELPQRQSKWAIVFIILKFAKNFLRQAWIFVIPLVLGRSQTSQWDTWELAIAGLGLFSSIGSIIAYFKYYYNLSHDELIIQKGILNKSNINIPYERIQSVNFKQTFLHRILNVTEVAIDTAGSGEKEIQIDALTLENANALRAAILEKKKSFATSLQLEPSESLVTLKTEVENIMTLSNKDLLKVGLTQNHLKPVGLVIGFVFSLYIYAWQLDIDPRDVYQNVTTFAADLSITQGVILFFILAFFSVLYSVVTTFLNHSNLQLNRSDKKFQLNQGLLTHKEIAAMDRKIQFISWGQNLLQRMLGFYNLSFQQAASNSIKQRIKNNFNIPGCTASKIEFIKQAWFSSVSMDHSTEGVSVHMFLYRLRYITIFFGLIIGVLAYFEIYNFAFAVFVIAVFTTYKHWLSFKKKGFYLDQDQLYLTGGGVGFKYSLLPTYKIQNISIVQNPYQWRRKLATVIIFTAAGALSIPFIKETRAQELMDFFLHNVEKSRRPWM